VWECGKPPFYYTSFLEGDRGKQEVPGNRGARSMKVGAFSLSMPYNSPKIQPDKNTDRPHVYLSSVIFFQQYYLRSPIPTSDHVTGQLPFQIFDRIYFFLITLGHRLLGHHFFFLGKLIVHVSPLNAFYTTG
jgi:hypothetical protein